MKNRRGLIVLALAIIVALVVYLNRGRVHFDWRMFATQLRLVDWRHIALGIGLIYSTYLLRAFRWSVFVSPAKRVSAWTLIGPQFVGFTAVALFGRLADLTRPYLVARRIELPVASQVAVYTIERMFDLGAAALIFSGALLFAPRDLPHHEIFVRTGIFSLAGTAALALFAAIVRVAGGVVADSLHAILRRLSRPLADGAQDKILAFREGLNAIGSAKEFFVAALLSLAMWGLIGEAYVQTAHAFPATPALGTLTYSRTMLLMGASIGASLLQVPILGWFTQIAATAAAMNQFYGAPIEAATACGALLLLVTFLSIIPAGLIFAQFTGISLKSVAEESGAAEEREIKPDSVAPPSV